MTVQEYRLEYLHVVFEGGVSEMLANVEWWY